MNKYDVIIIGGGHAGIEAAYAAARLQCSTLLLTLNLDNIGKLSCNPAIGGVAKSTLVKEVDALGGLIGRIADKTAISYRRLNKSKGKAVWSTRAQVDKIYYPQVARKLLEQHPYVKILEAKADKLIIKNGKLKGVQTNFGACFWGNSVVVCAGTFLGGVIHIGLHSFPGGRLYELASNKLLEQIKKLGIKIKFFKTGTCARIDKRSIDYSLMQEQPPEYDLEPFSIFNDTLPKNQVSCFITHTNARTHKIITDNLDKSPLYTGKIKSTGVRYCPSLEDKVVKFSGKHKHQIFIEPEGRNTFEVYPNGVSTSLPFDVQLDFIHTIKGLEKATILRPGYGIEHGLIDARCLYPNLECREIAGLFFAGQVNGTTGYEEAAAQGLIAGINAGLKAKNRGSFLLSRQESFIGVLIDDLVTKGVDEPYRVFTARSEYRIRLRESNAHFRLSDYARQLGILDKTAFTRVTRQKKLLEDILKEIKKSKVTFNNKKVSLAQLLKRPGVDFKEIIKLGNLEPADKIVQTEAEIEVKYQSFIRREEQNAKILENVNKVTIPDWVDFMKVPSLSTEVRDKLSFFKPTNLEQASKISGITPAAILQIYQYIQKNRK
jgi:tRNA uridine 5-carboxymethylaminomethyl modification enzyme